MAVIINRRGFIKGFASLVAAPAVLRVAPIMPVKPVALVKYDILHDAYVEISMGYKMVSKAMNDALYKSLFKPDNLGLIRSFQPTREVMMLEIQDRLYDEMWLP